MGGLVLKIFLTAGAWVTFLIASTQLEAKRIDKLEVHPVDLGKVADGLHQGGIIYQSQIVQVAVTTQSHRIADIQVVKHLSGSIYEKGAQTIVSQVIETQRVDLAVDSNETFLERTAKKALLLAIEGALNGTPVPSSDEQSPASVPSTLLLFAFFAGCASLGAHWAVRLASRAGMHGVARMWFAFEEIAFLGGGACCAFAIALMVMSQ